MTNLDKATRWESIDRNGFEHLQVRTTLGGFVAQSVVIGALDDAKYGIFYRVVLDGNWADGN